ncbi:MAG: repeat-associated core domain protein [Schlesneria sp.]|nr:repeat-associated core domain protein [Schlesneria sp.]
MDYTQPDVKYALVDLSGSNDPDTGDIYSGWDRFGRVKDCRWYDYGNSTDTVRLKYGYDRVSDRLWRADLVAQSLGKDFDELYSYDGLHRLQDMQRGLLNGTNTAITSENFAQCWSLDPTSNWQGFQEADTGGSWTTVQSRSANPVNEITDITNSVGSAWVTPAYDAAGNTTTIPQPADPTESYTATYDAWNRMVQLIDTNTTDTVQQNAYDPRTFRTVRKDYASGVLDETRHFFYTFQWQSIEERLGTSPDSADPERQYVWGRRYVDDLVLRDRDTDADSSLDERLYALQDANWNVVALIDTSATAQERYQYSAFGRPSFFSGNFVQTGNSTIESCRLFTGQQFDSVTMFYIFRNRFLDLLTGRFITRDRLGNADGANLYAAWFVPSKLDPSGLEAVSVDKKPGGGGYGSIIQTLGNVASKINAGNPESLTLHCGGVASVSVAVSIQCPQSGAVEVTAGAFDADTIGPNVIPLIGGFFPRPVVADDTLDYNASQVTCKPDEIITLSFSSQVKCWSKGLVGSQGYSSDPTSAHELYGSIQVWTMMGSTPKTIAKFTTSDSIVKCSCCEADELKLYGKIHS